MLSVLVIIIQFVTLIFIGGFARTTTVQQYFSYIGSNILFLFTWLLMNASFKKLALHSIVLLLITMAISFQTNLLFGRFWHDVFLGFDTSYELSASIVIQCTMAIFVALLVAIDYIGIFRFWPVYVILPIVIIFGWSFNYSVLRHGLLIFDGCGGLSVFLFAGGCSIGLWVFAIRGNPNRYAIQAPKQQAQIRPQLGTSIYYKQQYYDGYTISLYGGLVGTFLLWPSFNASLSLVSSATVTVIQSINHSLIFQNSAYSNTFLALSMGTVLSFVLINRDGTVQYKGRIRCLIDCFMNAGIICASFMDIALNPSVVMCLALISTVITLIFYYYYYNSQTKVKPINISAVITVLMYYSRPLFRIILTLLGIIVTAIVVSTRSYSTILLLDTGKYGSQIYSKTAGLQIAAYFITLIVSIITGLLCGLIVHLYYSYNQYKLQQNNDENINQNNTDGSKILHRKDVNKSQIVSPIQASPNPKSNRQDFSLFKGRRHDGLTDVDLFQQMPQEMFPLFLQPQDRFQDQQETTRKLLKQAILSHVKQNQNYISINHKHIQNTMRTNYQTNNLNRKLNYNEIPNKYVLQKQHILRNDHQPKPTASYFNKMIETPKSSSSIIRNQTKQIKQLKQQQQKLKSQQLKTQNNLKYQNQRQVMPQFYIDHIKKSQADLTNANYIKQPQNLQISRSSIKQHHRGGLIVSSKQNNNQSNPNQTRQPINADQQHKIQPRRTRSQAFLNSNINNHRIDQKKDDKYQMSEFDKIEEQRQDNNKHINSRSVGPNILSKKDIQFRSSQSSIRQENQHKE